MERKGLGTLLRLSLRGSVLTVGLLWFVNDRLSRPLPDPPPEQQRRPFLGRLAHQGAVTQRQARRVLRELGPAVADELRQGNQVVLPRFGKFRLTRVPLDPASAGGAARYSIDYLPDPDLLMEVTFPSADGMAQSAPVAATPVSLPTPPAR